MPDILAWLITLWALSLVGFPIAFAATGLGHLADQGWSVARPLSLLALAWLTWIGGTLGVIPNTRAGIAAMLLAMAAAAGWLAWAKRAELADFLRRRWRVLATTEALFLALFAFWALVVSEVPAINHTEKPMDFGIMNAVIAADRFPPEDQWLSGHSIAYYYGGHHLAAMLTKLSGVSPDVGYNLAIATIPGLFGAGILGLVYNLLRMAGSRASTALAAGIGSALAVVLLGNLSGVLELAYAVGVGGDGFWSWLAIKGLEPPAGGSGWVPDGFWWWWRGTRIIDTLAEGGASLDYTITEFPYFSFLLGDLHAHVSSLPYLTLALALALPVLVGPDPPGLTWIKNRPWEIGALALVFGTLAFINAWDFPVYLCLLGMIAVLRWLAWQNRAPPVSLLGPLPTGPQTGESGMGSVLRSSLGYGLLLTLALAACGIILYLPFYLSFDSQTSGILPLGGPATRPILFLTVMGVPSILAAGFVARAALDAGWPTGNRRAFALLAGSAGLGVFILWLVALTVRISLSPDELDLADNLVLGRLALAVPLLFKGSVAAYCALVLAAGRRPAHWIVFALTLAAVGFFLLAGAELFHIADQFGNRMNTVFKFYYQAWLLLGIAGAIGMYHILAVPLRHSWAGGWALGLAALRVAWVSVVAIFLIASAYYPAAALLERTGWLSEGESRADNTLSGLDHLQRSSPGEYAAVSWLSQSAQAGRIVEAVGDDYDSFGGMSGATGRATILSWEGHERQWRGDDINPELARRRTDVEAIYTTDDSVESRRLLQHYGVRWLVAGPRERRAYGDDVDARMIKWADAGWLTAAFETDGIVIYEVAGGAGSQ